jgi:hypothetical protein
MNDRSMYLSTKLCPARFYIEIGIYENALGYGLENVHT